MDRTSADNIFLFVKRLRRDGPARLVSDLINPLFLPPLVLSITGWLVGLSKWMLSGVTVFALIFYTFIPLTASVYLLKINHISSLDLPDRQARSRLFKYSIASALIGMLGFTFTQNFTHPLLTVIAFIYFLNPIIGFIINLKWKMSVHTAALSSAGSIFLSLSAFETVYASIETEVLSLTILLLLLPLMIWARYRLKIHTLPELFGGTLAGFIFTFIELYLFNYFW